MTRYKLHRTLMLIAVVMAVVMTGLLAGCGGETEYSAHSIKGVMPELAFELTDENGETVTAGDFDGDLQILFFGYTHCPDICPATMARIRAALGGLDQSQRDNTDVLFVSVDPERDPPKVLERFTSGFGPRFVGLTGSQEQLRALAKRYRTTYGYGEPNDDGYYLVSHSSAIFVFDGQDRARLLVSSDESVDALTADLEKLLRAQS